MTLAFLTKLNKNILKNIFIGFLVIITVNTSVVLADTLTYSPDQWPRHWGELMSQTQREQELYYSQQQPGYLTQRPERSPMWGVMPSARQKPRRTLRPEYNTQAHLQPYVSQNAYAGNYNSEFSSYGLSVPLASPLVIPYSAPGLVAPGLLPGMQQVGYPYGAYPGVYPAAYPGSYPYGAFPYATTPFIGRVPGMGYMW
jgi:hypothetical protein